MGMGKTKNIFKKAVKKTFALVLGLSIFAFLACEQNNNQQNDTDSIELLPSDGNIADIVSKPQSWHITNKRILVLFAYGFNENDTKENLLNLLDEKFGLDSKGGLISPVVYPDDFKHNAKSYANELYSKLQDETKDWAGVILLGAPENTHSALARNQDAWKQEVPYPVIALFPQDDILGLESTCDIVIDKGHAAVLAGEVENEEIDGQLIDEAPEVLCETVEYMVTLDYSLEKTTAIYAHLLQMLKGRNIRHYVDPETGLQSINHFVLGV